MENKIFIKKETMKGIADAIRAKDGTTEEIAVTDMAERIGAISGGYPWEEMVTAINLKSLNDFGKKKVELNFPNIKSLSKFCCPQSVEEKNVTVEELSITAALPIDGISQFMGGVSSADEVTLKKLTLNVDTSKAQNWSSAFKNLYGIEVIDGTPISLESAWTNTIGTVFSIGTLREIRFRGEISGSISFKAAPLSRESIESILSCLSTTASEMTLTLSLEAVNTAFETSSDAADGSTSTEWAELIATKPNWTISLV